MEKETITITRTVDIADNGYMVRTEEEGCDPGCEVMTDAMAASTLGKEMVEDIGRIADLTQKNRVRMTILLEGAE